jgi:hypothetical protein
MAARASDYAHPQPVVVPTAQPRSTAAWYARELASPTPRAGVLQLANYRSVGRKRAAAGPPTPAEIARIAAAIAAADQTLLYSIFPVTTDFNAVGRRVETAGQRDVDDGGSIIYSARLRSATSLMAVSMHRAAKVRAELDSPPPVVSAAMTFVAPVPQLSLVAPPVPGVKREAQHRIARAPARG